MIEVVFPKFENQAGYVLLWIGSNLANNPEFNLYRK